MLKNKNKSDSLAKRAIITTAHLHNTRYTSIVRFVRYSDQIPFHRVQFLQ